MGRLLIRALVTSVLTAALAASVPGQLATATATATRAHAHASVGLAAEAAAAERTAETERADHAGPTKPLPARSILLTLAVILAGGSAVVLAGLGYFGRGQRRRGVTRPPDR